MAIANNLATVNTNSIRPKEGNFDFQRRIDAMARGKDHLVFLRLAAHTLLWLSVASNSWNAAAQPLAKPRPILYVTNSGGDDITLVDVATHKAIGSIQTGPTPHGLEASPDGSRVYVSGETDDDIVAVDTATSRVLWKVPISGRV